MQNWVSPRNAAATIPRPPMRRLSPLARATTAIPAAAPQRLVYPVEANEIFLQVSAEEAARLRAAGFDFYDWAPGEIRLVTSWDQQGEAVGRLAAAIAAL